MIYFISDDMITDPKNLALSRALLYKYLQLFT